MLASTRDREAAFQRKLFSPANLRPESLGLWLDAADLSTISITSGAISTWRDKSGFGNHHTQSTASKRPTLVQGVYNGLPTVRFSRASSQEIGKLTLVGPITNNNPVTCIVVANASTSTTNDETIFALSGNASFDQHSVHLFKEGSAFRAVLAEWSVSNTSVFGYNGGSLAIFLCRNASNLRELIASGRAGNTNTTAGSSRSIVNSNLGGRYVGDYLQGDVCEVVVCKSTLPKRIYEKLVGGLAWKWGLRANLYGAHPWRNTPPLIGD